MKSKVTRTIALPSIIGAMLLLAGCYTVEGAGRDVAATGAGIAAGAEQTREYGADQPGPGSTSEQRKTNRY